MHVARRLYLYVISAITLSMVAAGLVLLARYLLKDVFPATDFGFGFDDGSGNQNLSQAIALLAVGIPAWAVHWRHAQRGLEESNPAHADERGSAIRAAYLTLVLYVSLVLWLQGLAGFLTWLVTGALDVRSEFDFADPLGTSTLAIVALAVWLFHVVALRRDLATALARGAAAWLPRLYVYGIAVATLFSALQAIEAIGTTLLTSTPSIGDTDSFRTTFLITEGVTVVLSGLIAVGHWAAGNRLLRQADEARRTNERFARTRAGAFAFVVVFSATVALENVAAVIHTLISPSIGPDLGPGIGNGFSSSTLTTAVLGVVLYGATWVLASRAFSREPAAAADPLRAVQQARLTSHGIAATMLVMGGVGAAWFAAYAIDVVLGGSRTSTFGSDYELPSYLALTAVGLPAWFLAWRDVMARRRRDPLGEATSAIRRSFLYLTIGTALVVVMVPAVLILDQLVSGLLISGSGGSLADLSTPLGVLAVAGVALVYHWLQLRGDKRASATPTEPMLPTGPTAPDPSGAHGAGSAPPATEPAMPSPPASATDAGRAVVLETIPLTLRVPAGSDARSTLAALHAVLPVGSELDTARA